MGDEFDSTELAGALDEASAEQLRKARKSGNALAIMEANARAQEQQQLHAMRHTSKFAGRKWGLKTARQREAGGKNREGSKR